MGEKKKLIGAPLGFSNSTSGRILFGIFCFIAVAALAFGLAGFIIALQDRNNIECDNNACVAPNSCTTVGCIDGTCQTLGTVPGCCPTPGTCPAGTTVNYNIDTLGLVATGDQITLNGAFGYTTTLNAQASAGNSFTIELPRAGTHFVALYAHTTFASNTYNTTTNETDYLKTATCSPVCSCAAGYCGFQVIGNTLVAGKSMRYKGYGTYSTNGATATITQAMRLTQLNGSVSVIPGVGTPSATFARYDRMVICL